MKDIFRSKTRWAVAVIALVFAACVMGTWVAHGSADRQRDEEIKEFRRQNSAAYEMSLAFGRTAEFVLPSVVNIVVEKKVAVSGRPQLPPGFEHWPFPFPMPDPRRLPRERDDERELKVPGVGSGFVYDERGYVVTNWHVVKDAELNDIRMIFRDGREYTPTEIFRDARSDLAVLRIEGGPFPSLELADASEILPGQLVLAVGSPSGFGFSVSGGVVSATSTMNRFMAGKRLRNFRVTGDPYALEDYIQTDTTINPGNSGGPLIDLYGRVLGVNTLIFSRTGQYGGLAFAVPSDKVRRVVDQLISEGRVTRGHLGVQIVDTEDLDDETVWRGLKYKSFEELSKDLKIDKKDSGALVVNVLDGTPASQGGIMEGDLIVSVGGKDVPDVNALRSLVANTTPDTTVEVVVKRKGETRRLQVKIGDQPTPEALLAQAEPQFEEYGIKVQDLTPELAEALGIKADKGVVITDVKPGSAADRQKLVPGTVILDVQVEGALQPVRGVRDLNAALSKAGRDGATLRVSYRGSVRFVVLKP